jgi:adenylate cyclase
VKGSKKGARAEEVETRRQSERLSIELPIAISVPGGRGKASTEQAITLDLSRGGVSFATPRAYQPGMSIQLSFPDLQFLPRKVRSIHAQVVRVGKLAPDKSRAVAVRFVDMDLANLIFSELLRAHMRTSSALLGIIRALTPGAEMEVVIEDICRATERAMDAEKGMLFLRVPQRSILRTTLSLDGRKKEIQIHLGEGLVGIVAERGRVTNVPSLAADRHYLPRAEKYFDKNTRSVLCVPLSKEGGVSPGVLVFLNKRYGRFTREDEALGTAVASQISVVLLEARLFTNIRNLKDYYERIFESVATGILTFDEFGKLATINRAGTEIFGFQTSSDVGKEFESLFSGPANVRLASLTRDVLIQQRARKAYDIRYLRRDGSNFSLDLNALPLADSVNNFRGGVLVAEDITHEQRLMSTLCRYMAREVAEQVLQNKDELKLGGTRTEVAILITDIRNFTSISEQMDPWNVVDLLNAYFPRMINVFFRHQGMVDKFIGDSILAVFGVPIPKKDDALRAVQAALELRRQVRAINQERARKGLMTVEIGIGITSGTVISGNIGSERRMDYTVIGDPVNLAARLEGLTKEVQRMILVDERVEKVIRSAIPCEALGSFAVKGKREKVPVFAVQTSDENA